MVRLPRIFRKNGVEIKGQEQINRQKRAVTVGSVTANHVADIEVHFQDPTLETEIQKFLEDINSYLLSPSITLTDAKVTSASMKQPQPVNARRTTDVLGRQYVLRQIHSVPASAHFHGRNIAQTRTLVHRPLRKVPCGLVIKLNSAPLFEPRPRFDFFEAQDIGMSDTPLTSMKRFLAICKLASMRDHFVCFPKAYLVHSAVRNITVTPAHPYVGDTLTIVCHFSGYASDISWSKDSIKISGDSKHMITNNPQYTTLVVKVVSKSDAGNYQCIIKTDSDNQVQNTQVDIIALTIKKSDDVDVACNGSVLNLTCCSGDSNTFNVTWEITGSLKIMGHARYNSTCNIYTIQPNLSECPAEQSGFITIYKCAFQGINGAATVSQIAVTYIRKANVQILPVVPLLIGSPLEITCQSDVPNNGVFVWSKDNSADKIDQLWYSTAYNTSILKTSIATMDWSGTYFCSFNQKIFSSTVTLSVTIVPLPSAQAIQVAPLEITRPCNFSQTLTCCFPNNGDYTVKFSYDSGEITAKNYSYIGNQICYTADYPVKCDSSKPDTAITCVIVNELGATTKSADIIITSWDGISDKSCEAQDSLPSSPDGGKYSILCHKLDPKQMGTIDFICIKGSWTSTNNCYSARLFTQLLQVEALASSPQVQKQVTDFLVNLSDVSTSEKQNISTSTQNLKFMLTILYAVSQINTTVGTDMMESYITTVNVVVDNSSTWQAISNSSSQIILSVEDFAKKLQVENDFETNQSNSNVQLKGKNVNSSASYSPVFKFSDLSGTVSIENNSLPKTNITIVSIAYTSLKDILPPGKPKVINGLIISTIVQGNVNFNNFNVSMTFQKSNSSLSYPECVFWDFNLSQPGWNNESCTSTGEDKDNIVTCNCNHLTSFSILMGDKSKSNFLDTITYIGVGISIFCLFLTLLIEYIAWRSLIKNKTSYLRHVCLVNLAVSLLAADIWFIIGAALEKYPDSKACLTAAFFSFFFYLALFFWMLTTGLILFYRMIYILHDMSRKTMMVNAFFLGYACPLIISVITVAVTAPNNQFTSGEFCWLDVDTSMSFLAFVVPALTIVFINFIILLVVIAKLLRPSIGERPGKDEKLILVQITKSMAVLTPLLGITWGFGLGVAIKPDNTALQGIFAALNSFQGLFILLSTVLLDQKVRTAVGNSVSWSYLSTFKNKVQTLSTNSSAPSERIRKKVIFPKKGGYNIFAPSSSENEVSIDSYSVIS
ncbi:adhesion G protein-coupled receptor F5-like [Pelodytes ibericus]